MDDETTHYGWDGNRLLLERQGDRQQLYIYQPRSFVLLAMVRSDATKTEQPQSLSPEYQVLKEQYPEEWEVTLNKMPRKIAATIRLLEQPASPDKSPVDILYYHTDHLGSPRELTDKDGHIVWSAMYKAWGDTAKIDRPGRLIADTQGNVQIQRWEAQEKPVEQNLRFQGQYYDQETGLHYNRFRYYDPDCGRFISQDPIGIEGGENVYQYAPNPTIWTDPRGLKPRPGGGYATHSGAHPRKVNGRMPINCAWAGKTMPLSELNPSILEKYPGLVNKYPHGVPFNMFGFPDFLRYSKYNVRIELGSSRDVDSARANKAAGLPSTPSGYTWHHHQDSGYMQLIPTDIHDAVKHSGGVAASKCG